MLHALLADHDKERLWEKVCHGQELAQCKEEQKIQLKLMKVLMEGIPQVPPPRPPSPENVFRR